MGVQSLTTVLFWSPSPRWMYLNQTHERHYWWELYATVALTPFLAMFVGLPAEGVCRPREPVRRRQRRSL